MFVKLLGNYLYNYFIVIEFRAGIECIGLGFRFRYYSKCLRSKLKMSDFFQFGVVIPLDRSCSFFNFALKYFDTCRPSHKLP